MPRMHWHREQIRSEQTTKQSVLIVGSQSLVYIATLRVIHQYCACAQLDSTAIFTTRRDRKGIQPVKKLVECWRGYLVISVRPCLSQVLSSIETAERTELVLGRELPSTYPTLCHEKIIVPPKIRVLPSGTLSHNMDLKKFRHGKSMVLSTKLVTVELVDHTYDGRSVVAGGRSLLHASGL